MCFQIKIQIQMTFQIPLRDIALAGYLEKNKKSQTLRNVVVSIHKIVFFFICDFFIPKLDKNVRFWCFFQFVVIVTVECNFKCLLIQGLWTLYNCIKSFFLSLSNFRDMSVLRFHKWAKSGKIVKKRRDFKSFPRYWSI